MVARADTSRRRHADDDDRTFGELSPLARPLRLLFSIRSLLGAAAFAFPDAEAELLLAAQAFGFLTGFAFFVSSMTFTVRQTRLYLSLSGPADLRRRGRLHEDGFTFHAIKLAALFSFVVTAATLWLLDISIADAVLPPAFFIKLLMFICLSTFSVGYFALHFGFAGRAAGHDAA